MYLHNLVKKQVGGRVVGGGIVSHPKGGKGEAEGLSSVNE